VPNVTLELSRSDKSVNHMLLSMTNTELLELLKAGRTKRRYREQTGSVVKR
jgi:hypothetical protein